MATIAGLNKQESQNLEDIRDKTVNGLELLGQVSTGNSTSTPLGIDGTFTGEWEDCLNCAIIYVSVTSDQDSATSGLIIEGSDNQADVLTEDKYTIVGNAKKTFSFQAPTQYYRVRYTNGTIAQTKFRLSIVTKTTYGKPSSHRIQDSIADDDDAELVKAVLTGKSNGTFKNVLTTADGNLTVSDNSSGLAIAQGNVSGVDFVHKFGNAPDFDATDGTVTVWDGAEDGTTWENMVYDYSTTADIDRISSSDNGDTQDIQIQGLDANYALVTQTITLTGQTPVALTTSLIRVFRMVNVNTTDVAGHVFCFVNVATTGGVPNTPANIRAIIQPGNNQTLMALYTVPANTTGYMRDWYAAIAGANKTSNYVIQLRARPFGGVFQIKHYSAISDTGTSAYQHSYTEPEKFEEKTDIEMRCMATGVGVTGASISAGFDLVLVNN